MSRPPRGLTLAQRIERLVEYDPFGGCWLWSGTIRKYAATPKRPRAKIEVAGRQVLGHRAAYEAFKGPIPDGMYVLHRCDVTVCVNPDHLFLGTHDDNMIDMVRKGRRLSAPGSTPRTSPYTGVYPNRQADRPWLAAIRIGGRGGQMKSLGTYATPEDARDAYRRARAIRDKFYRNNPGKEARAAIQALAEILIDVRRAA